MLLTIITINYNNAAGLQKTVESVLSQTSTDFEYIIVDGASTDGSVEYLETINYKLQTANCKLISEPDSGIYNAMNKGIGMAKGDYVHFLNSGDWLTHNTVVEQMLTELCDCDILVGTKVSVRTDAKVRTDKIFNKPLSMYTFYRGTIEHTSAYIKRSLFDSYGYYDESLRIVSDWKWYLQRVVFDNVRVKFTAIPVSYFDTTGISSTNHQLDKEERRKVLEELLPHSILLDYDMYSFHIEQMERLKRYPLLYKIVYVTERILFKIDKWRIKQLSWKKNS